MKIEFDYYTKVNGSFFIHHVTLNEDEILECAKQKALSGLSETEESNWDSIHIDKTIID